MYEVINIIAILGITTKTVISITKANYYSFFGWLLSLIFYLYWLSK